MTEIEWCLNYVDNAVLTLTVLLDAVSNPKHPLYATRIEHEVKDGLKHLEPAAELLKLKKGE